MKSISHYTFHFQDVDRTKSATVGGKGANLGELSKIKEICVPDGFCISTDAFKRIIGETPLIKELINQLSPLKTEDQDEITEISGEIRRLIEGIVIPQDISEEITRRLFKFGEKDAFAVRSSATAEDLPTASFAGQQDTYLNIIGTEEILKHTAKRWASLFTDRAVIYRLQNGFDHNQVYLSVIVQEMIFPQAAGILFTADPVTSNRKVLSIDAGFGLCEALVSGLVNADVYKASDGEIINKKISAKKLAVYALVSGGTKIDDKFYIVQSRPITTLYPIPKANDQENHVYVSVGHQQMMTDAMKPLGLSFFLLLTPAPMRTSGGRLFVDVTQMLATSDGREILLNVLGKSDPLVKDALTTLLERGDFIKLLPGNKQEQNSGESDKGKSAADYQTPNEYDPKVVSELIERSQTSIDRLKQNIKTKSGTELFDFILEDISQPKKSMSDSQSFGVIMTGMNAAARVIEKMNEWLGETNAADTLSQSVPNNVTSEMGLELLDVADVIRPYPKIIEYLQKTKDENFLDRLDKFDGGTQARDAILSYLDKYGMRCAGEIDITRLHWSEKPLTLVPAILNNVKNLEPLKESENSSRGDRRLWKKNASCWSN